MPRRTGSERGKIPIETALHSFRELFIDWVHLSYRKFRYISSSMGTSGPLRWTLMASPDCLFCRFLCNKWANNGLFPELLPKDVLAWCRSGVQSIGESGKRGDYSGTQGYCGWAITHSPPTLHPLSPPLSFWCGLGNKSDLAHSCASCLRPPHGGRNANFHTTSLPPLVALTIIFETMWSCNMMLFPRSAVICHRSKVSGHIWFGGLTRTGSLLIKGQWDCLKTSKSTPVPRWYP